MMGILLRTMTNSFGADMIFRLNVASVPNILFSLLPRTTKMGIFTAAALCEGTDINGGWYLHPQVHDQNSLQLFSGPLVRTYGLHVTIL